MTKNSSSSRVPAALSSKKPPQLPRNGELVEIMSRFKRASRAERNCNQRHRLCTLHSNRMEKDRARVPNTTYSTGNTHTPEGLKDTRAKAKSRFPMCEQRDTQHIEQEILPEASKTDRQHPCTACTSGGSEPLGKRTNQRSRQGSTTLASHAAPRVKHGTRPKLSPRCP